MTPVRSRALLLCLLLPALFAPAPPLRRSPPAKYIHDGAGLFKSDVIHRADRELADIHEMHGLVLHIETLKTLPAKERSQLSMWKVKREKDRLLIDWARKRAVEKKFDGVYAVIIIDPRLAYVVGSSPEVDTQFSRAQQEEVRRQLDLRLRRENYDDALLAGVDTVREILDNPSPMNYWVLAMVLGALLALWGCLMLMLKRGTAAAVPAGPQGQSRADRLPAMLGAMFGTPAGFWVYDRLFQGGPSVPPDHDRGFQETAADPLAGLVTTPPPADGIASAPAPVTTIDRHAAGS